MHPLIEQHREAIAELCRKHCLKRLELFGSAARGDYREDSDFDFLYEFEEPTDDLVNRYFGM